MLKRLFGDWPVLMQGVGAPSNAAFARSSMYRDDNRVGAQPMILNCWFERILSRESGDFLLLTMILPAIKGGKQFWIGLFKFVRGKVISFHSPFRWIRFVTKFPGLLRKPFERGATTSLLDSKRLIPTPWQAQKNDKTRFGNIAACFRPGKITAAPLWPDLLSGFPMIRRRALPKILILLNGSCRSTCWNFFA